MCIRDRGYILAGAALGLIANCYIIPYSRSMATRHLLTKYQTLTELLTLSLIHISGRLLGKCPSHAHVVYD